ncbi:MAG: ATP-dependent DNA ligase [Candidatus Methanospirare jalkutatii]|nr:MAG: ATP-dependent DNA ligase [Candidatus Methanospirare jalkutatii]UYZ40417.1 MAG: ATP-dependent DNA ligase [Candidatus Methanospirare jalkutatii]
MRYSELVEVCEEIEATTKRLEMTDLLVKLFKKTPAELIDKVIYLIQGKIYPDFVGIKLGIAEKLAIKAISQAYGVDKNEVLRDFKRLGDLGTVAKELAAKRTQAVLASAPLTVERVHETLDEIARASGARSQEAKIGLLAGLLSDANPKEAKFIVRTVTGKMRLGIADMTILDALAIAYTGEKENRKHIERAYNTSSDLGDVAKTLATSGLEGIKNYKIRVGRPIRMMLAQRLASADEILNKLGGEAACEWKYDGERIQIHKKGKEVILFSRRLENITEQYPDVCATVREHVRCNEAIIEGECVAVHPDTGELLPFQELMHRRRKYGVEDAAKKFPVSLFLFDVLYMDGEDLTQQEYIVRRKKLEEIVRCDERIRLTEMLRTSDLGEVERFFEHAIEAGCEGLILKALNGVYQAGARGWLWIKLKRSYQSKMVEPIDVVVVGAFHGRGRRSGSYGALLAAVYDKENDVFTTISKVGSGFKDEDLENLPKMLSPYEIEHVHPRVKSEIEADVWFTPSVVMEIIGDELTLSPVHTTAFGKIREGAGIAVRFPRFTGRWRFDKSPEDATTVEEIVEMYKSQLKKVE